MESDDEYNYSGDEYVYEDGDLADENETDPPENFKFENKRDSFGNLKYEKPNIVIPDGSYIITEYSAVIPLMDYLISTVASLLNLDTDATQILLQNCRWNKEKLMDNFFSSSAKVLEEAGLDLHTSEILASLGENRPLVRFLSPDSRREFVCRICCESTEVNKAFSLGCGHLFCRPCYKEYLNSQISDGPSCIKAHCPQHKCKQAITKTIVLKFTETKVSNNYNIFVTRNFMETSKTMKYCPAAGCDKVAIGSGITTVRCVCGMSFCFRCGEEAHDPSTCTQLSEWRTKCMNESETANWILANTKKCPSCNARIEKNHGCNHMNCKLCKHEFCWICMGSWVDHGQNTGGYYKCNRYDVVKVDVQATAAQRAKEELDRYLHYYQRYHGHDQALRHAAGQRETAERRMVERQEAEKGIWMDVQFLRQAAETVIDCRRVLKYTYVLGYFMQEGDLDKRLFEHHQEMLEKNTERLHEMTEQALDLIDRTQVVNLTRITDRFLQSLLGKMSDAERGAGPDRSV